MRPPQRAQQPDEAHRQGRTALADTGDAILQSLRCTGDGAALAGPILALGAWFNNTPCLLERERALFSPNLGDLDTPDACRRVEPAVAALLAATPVPPLVVAHDLHPDFHSTRVALATANRLGVPALAVQHHHAHIGAVLAEHGRFDTRPVLGLAVDGVGLGSDGQAWGGELLRVRGARCERIGHLRPLRLPGGDRAAREPWRMASALLYACGRGSEIAHRFSHQPAAALLAQVLSRPTLSPPTTSLGRHFDAAAGLLGVCEVMHTDAEAAVALESLARAYGELPALADGWRISPDLELDLHPLLLQLADEADAARGAARFHVTLAAALTDWIEHALALEHCDTVVLGGGCMHNRVLSAMLDTALSTRGLTVLGARRLSPGDAGIALGQAWVARHRLTLKET